MPTPHSLASFLRQHGITVLAINEDSIKVQAAYSRQVSVHGEPLHVVSFTQPETIVATEKAVRDWLGY